MTKVAPKNQIPDFFRQLPANRPGVTGIAIELLFWFLPPTLFLLDFLFFWHRPATALTHLVFVAEVVATVILLRTVLMRRFSGRWVALLASAVAGLLLFVMLAYYILVHLLLGVWARVMTVEVFTTYLQQASHLCEAVGIPFPLAVALLALAFALCWALAYACLKRSAWVPGTRRPRALTDTLLLALALLTAYRAWDFTQVRGPMSEPLNLTLWSGKPGGVTRYFSQGLHIPARLIEAERRETDSYAPVPGGTRPNLVLIVVDGLRYDHLGVNGYARATTPFLSSLASEGKLGIFSDIRASCGETTCALSSMMASRYSHNMPARPFTLTKVLKRNGYLVRMIMGAYHPDSEALYGPVDDFVDGTMINGTYLADDAWVLERTAALPPWDRQPLMLQYHLMAAHTLGRHHQQYQLFQPAERYTGKISGAPEARHRNYYDNGVLQADGEIRQILDHLQGKGYLRDAYVVITGDHGESLGEHNKYAHTNSVHEELLHVPLMSLRYKNGVALPGQRVTQSGSQIDIAPTILHELELAIPSTWAGKPLPLQQALDFTFFQMVPYLGLYDQRDTGHRWKFYINIHNNEEFAFDLKRDPKEEVNLVRQLPAQLLLDWRARLRAIDRTAQSQAGALN